MRLSAIGDVCHAVAMVQAVQQQRPDIQITWIIGKIEYQLLQGLPGINFVVFDKKLGRAARKALKRQLSDTEFDALFMMQVALRANWVSRVVRTKLRIGFDDHRSKELHSLFTNHQINHQQHAHVLEGFMEFAATIGVTPPVRPTWTMPIGEDDHTFAQQQTQTFENYVVICPAASKAERCWSASRYANVADRLHRQGYHVLICGAPAPLDKSLADDISQQCKAPVLNLVGQTSLKQLLAVLAKAKLVIAPDTGPAHMATTVGTTVIGLYAHSNPRRTGPYCNIQDTVSVYDEVICQQTGKPWQELPWGKRAKGQGLMQLITVEAVNQRIDEVLGSEHSQSVPR